MRIEQSILKVSLLGINNYPFNSTIFPDEIAKLLESSEVSASNSSKLYLDGLSLYKAYVQAGTKLEKIEGISKEILTAPKERLPLCDEEMEQLLKMMLLEGSGSFISFFPNFIALVNEREVILPSKYFSQIPNNDRDTIKAFGERAKWIKSLEEGVETTKVDYLSLKKAERNSIFYKLVKEDRAEAKFFLEEVFDFETVASQLNYLKIIMDEMYEVDGELQALIVFIKEKISFTSSKSKTVKKIKASLLKSELMLHGKTFDSYYENIFSKIWKIEKKRFILKEREALKELFESLAFFEDDVDTLLYYIFSIVPIERWCELLSIEAIPLIKKVESMQITYTHEILLDLLGNQILRSRDKSLIHAYLKFKNYSIGNFTFLKYFSQEEIVHFADEYIEKLLKHQVDIIDMFENEKRFYFDWSEALSLTIVKGLFKQKNIFYKREWTKAIWTIAPYLHSSGVEWIEKQLQSSNLPSDFEDLEEHFGTIKKIKELFDKIELKKH